MEELADSLSRPYLADWPVARALEAYLAENGFTREQYDAPVVPITLWRLTIPFPNLPSRRVAIRMHDLHHLVTGYGTDPTGEAEISAWELRRGTGVFSAFVRAIILSGFAFGLLHSPRRTLAAWRSARHTDGVRLQPTEMDRYARLLTLTIGELRNLYGVSPSGLAGARALHHGAPSRRNTSA